MQKLIRGWNHRLENYTDVITNWLTATTYLIFKGSTCSWSDGGWITINRVCNLVVSTNPADGEVYSIPRYVIKFVSVMRQVGVFSLILEDMLSMWTCRHILLQWQPEPLNRNESGRFGALKSDSTHHFFRNACTKSESLRFSQFSGCWLILSVYIIMSFDFPFVRLFGVR